MAAFIHPDNQTYIWNTIHSHPKFKPYVQQIPANQMAQWFRSVIEGFYRKWGETRPMTKDELVQLNQNTVAYMLNTIGRLISQPLEPQLLAHQQPLMPKPLPQFDGQYEFEQRAQEYQAMNTKPVVPPLQGQTDVETRESQDVMERRLMEQQRLRENDIQMFSTPSHVSGSAAINLNLLKPTANPMSQTLPFVEPTFPENIKIVVGESDTAQLQKQVSQTPASTTSKQDRIAVLEEKLENTLAQLVKLVGILSQLTESLNKKPPDSGNETMDEISAT